MAVAVSGFAAGGGGMTSNSGSAAVLRDAAAAVGVTACAGELTTSKSKPTPISGRLALSALHPEWAPNFGKPFCLMKIGKIQQM